MAWIKIPAENHPLFLAALPKDPRISTLRMFGGLAALVNGHMFSGLFARSVMAKLSPADQAAALALDGTSPFDPMGNGRVMTDTLLLAEEVMDDPQVLRDWLRRSFDFALTLPPKPPKGAKAKPAAKPAAKAKPPPATKAKPAAKAKPPPATKAKPAAKAKAAARARR
jgi:TfoX/Sxy family transcriptional regulator of competence genes